MKKILISSAVVVLGFIVSTTSVFADTISATFEPATYSVGNINAQDGWMKTGPYDVSVATNTYGFTSFGSQSLRISDSVTGGGFGDQTFSKALMNEAGETDALNGGMSGGVRQNHFEAQFDLASTMATVQPGMHVSVSPDRGDGARMSYLRFEDSTNGINVFFDDVQGTTNPANFVETQIATDLSRVAPHTIKLVIDFVDGASNDVVKVYIDNVLVHTGTTWENYYRFDPESNPSLISNSRTVDSLIFRESGAATLANLGNGYLIDNLSLSSSTDVDQGALCKNGGWTSFVNPTFKNQGACVSFYASSKKAKAFGDIKMANPSQKMTFTAIDSGVNSSADTGMVEYYNYEYPGPLHYSAPVLCSNINTSTKVARLMFQIPVGWPGLTGIYVISQVTDGVTDMYAQNATWDLATAKNICENGGGFTSYQITSGDVVVK